MSEIREDRTLGDGDYRRVQREVRRLTEENGDLLQRLAAASREIERLRALVIDLKKTRRLV